MKISLGRFLALFLSMFVFAGAFTVAAQDLDDVSITGRITDSNGLAIAGASVTATETVTGTTRTVNTNDEGRYRIIELKPGTYTVKASATGFGAKERIDLTTVSGQNLQLDFNLAPGDVQAQTTVTVNDDDAPMVDTTRTVVGGTITEREIEEIPNHSRNPLDLVLTLGGTSEEALSTRDLAEDRNAANRLPPTEQGNFSLSGGASYSNNITIDGFDNNDDRSAQSRFQPSLEAIAEVQVITSQFSAEYGRASGGRINLRTKAGSNKFRGRAFMFMRHDNWNANTYYNNQTFYSLDDSFRYNGGTGSNTNVTDLNTITANILRSPLGRPDFVNYNPGFTFSGPVILPFGEGKSIYDGHNRTFFSIAYEYDNFQDTTLIDTYFPVGSNSRFPLPAATSSEAICETRSTTSTCANGGAALMSQYVQTLQTPNINHIFTARVDHKLFKENDLTVGFQLGRRRNQRQNVVSTTRLEEALQGSSSDTDAVNFTDNHVFGNAVNQFRMQWSRYLPSYETKNPGASVVLISYGDPLVFTNTTKTLIAGNSTASLTATGLFADKRRENRWQFQDSLTWMIKEHTFKGGFDVQRINSFNLDQSDATGTYNFALSSTATNASSTGWTTPGGVLYSGMQNFLLNQPTRYRQNFDTASTIKNTYWGLFVNNEIRMLSNLTLSLGVRYERETILADSNNFGPRLGVSWDPFKDGKSALRFGAGIFYNRVLLRSIDDFIILGQQNAFDTSNVTNGSGNSLRRQVLGALAQTFPKNYSSAQELKSYLVSKGFSDGIGFVTGSDNFTRLVDTATLKIPESYQFNVGYEREIGKGFVVEANYTWNKTVHLWGESNPNAPSLSIANARFGTQYNDWSEYLDANNFIIGTTTFDFYFGDSTDNVGLRTTPPPNVPTTCTGTCRWVNLNTINPSQGSTQPIGLALQAVNQFRPSLNDSNPNNNNLGQQELLASDRKAFYHGLILEIRSRLKKFGAGFSGNFRAAYTLASLKDDGLNNTSDAEANGDFGREWSRGLQDRRHRLAVSGTFNTPFWLGKIKLSPLFRFGSSAPFNLSYSGIDRNLDDVSNDRMNFSGDLNNIKWRKPGSPAPTALLSQFSLQPIGAKGGNLPRNAGTGPVFWTFDMNFTREWKLSERTKLRPTVEIDNILNASVLSFGSGFIDYSTFGVPSNISVTACFPTSSTACLPPVGSTIFRTNQKLSFENNEFLIPTRALRPRQIRLGVRFDF
jgi:hypothetical protein